MKTILLLARILCVLQVLILLLPCLAFSQAEVQAWGNFRGIRVNGQLYQFETSLRVVGDNWRQIRSTGKERNWTRYNREGDRQIVRTRMDSLFWEQEVIDLSPGTARVTITFDPHTDTIFTGAFFHIRLPGNHYRNAQMIVKEPANIDLRDYVKVPSDTNELMRIVTQEIGIQGEYRQFTLNAESPSFCIAKIHPITHDVELYVQLQSHKAKNGQQITNTFELSVSGEPDTRTAHLQLYPDFPGKTFLGLGGNFRLQNPRMDPQVIDYCLDNLDVRMGRAEMPWSLWHPVDSINPLDAARNGNLHPHVKSSMEMAQRLYNMGMPVLLGAWFPPDWAALGEVRRNPRNPDGTLGFPLDSSRIEDIYASLTDYIIYLKEEYGVEVDMFSFNESDIGINVRQTPQEHADLIKGLGAYMESKGLQTKLLLGDASDANGYSFVDAALEDPATWRYIGAVSFHSWRGWDKATLLEWLDASDRLDVPLIIGEGSIDAAAWRYPGIFQESHYAMEEIKLYTRILAICQPESILQWQLTADYSPLAGGGIFGNDAPLQPTQRFWNLKQLSMTPEGLKSMPLTCDIENLHVAALGDKNKNIYTFHLVNDGPSREVVLKGLPDQLKKLRLYITDANRGVEKGELIKVKNGETRFTIGPACFVSLFSE